SSDFAANQAPKVKSGKVATLTGSAEPGQSDIANLDKDTVDQFDAWSFNRAQALTAANVKTLSQSGALTSGWYYDPFFNFYTFVPSHAWFSSPYGFGFFNNYRGSSYYPPYYYGGSYYVTNTVIAHSASVSPRVPPRVVTGNDRSAVSRATDHRYHSIGGDFG